MASYRELLGRVKEEIEEISSTRARDLLSSDASPLFVDVREPDEWEEGHIPQAIHVPSVRPREQAVPPRGGAR